MMLPSYNDITDIHPAIRAGQRALSSAERFRVSAMRVVMAAQQAQAATAPAPDPLSAAALSLFMEVVAASSRKGIVLTREDSVALVELRHLARNATERQALLSALYGAVILFDRGGATRDSGLLSVLMEAWRTLEAFGIYTMLGVAKQG